jgi:hypothetical protein
LKILYFLILNFILNIFVFSQNNIFSGYNAWLYDSVLSSNAFEGRKSGTEGGVKAINWISEKFKEWNLSPGGENKKYEQKFSMLVTEEVRVPKMIIRNAQRGELDLIEGEDFALFTNSGSGKIESDLIFVGYGLNQTEWNDYKNIDVKGKIVLVLDGVPEKIKNNFDSPADRNHKFKIASKMGAAGFLMYRAPAPTPIKGAAIQKENYDKNMIGAYIPDWVAREIFKGTTKTIDELKENLKEKPVSFNTKKKIYLEAELREIQNGLGENVIGEIPGSDPVLKNEYIVFGAHMDHLGKSPNGYVYAGSDDNGSGTSLVMELARSLKQSGIKFKRSLMFIGFGGEEQGLLGSNYFVENPTIEKNKIAAMINFDMVGVGDGGFGIGGIESIRKYWDEFILTLTEQEKKKIYTGRAGLGGSDYTPFKIAGIPATTVGSSGSHKYYHVIEDNYKYVQPDVMDFIGKVFYKLGKFLGEYPKSMLSNYMAEKTLLSSCSVSDLYTNDVKLEDLQNENFSKEKLEKYTKVKTFNVFNGKETENFEEVIKKIAEIVDFQKKNLEYTKLALNGSEVRSNINGSKLVCMPVIDRIILNPVLLKTLAQMGIKNYKIAYNKFNELDFNNFLFHLGENDCTVEIYQDNDNFLDLVSIPKFDKIILSGDFNFWQKNYEVQKIFIKEHKTGCILYLNGKNFDQNKTINLIKKFDKYQLHINISDLLKEKEDIVYELIQNLKKEKYEDDDIRNIFGGKLVKFL